MNIRLHQILAKQYFFGYPIKGSFRTPFPSAACLLLDAGNNFHIDIKWLSASRQTIDSRELTELAQSSAALKTGKIQAFISKQMVDELLKVLTYPNHLFQSRGLNIYLQTVLAQLVPTPRGEPPIFTQISGGASTQTLMGFVLQQA